MTANEVIEKINTSLLNNLCTLRQGVQRAVPVQVEFEGTYRTHFPATRENIRDIECHRNQFIQFFQGKQKIMSHELRYYIRLYTGDK